MKSNNVNWISVADRCPEPGQRVIYSFDKIAGVEGIFHYFQIGPLPLIPCFSSAIGWIAAEWWREIEEEG